MLSFLLAMLAIIGFAAAVAWSVVVIFCSVLAWIDGERDWRFFLVLMFWPLVELFHALLDWCRSKRNDAVRPGSGRAPGEPGSERRERPIDNPRDLR